jgi:hypothetical protein
MMDTINRSRNVLIAVTSAIRALQNQITIRRSGTAELNATPNVLSHNPPAMLISLRRRLRPPPPRLEIRFTTLLRAVMHSCLMKYANLSSSSNAVDRRRMFMRWLDECQKSLNHISFDASLRAPINSCMVRSFAITTDFVDTT